MCIACCPFCRESGARYVSCNKIQGDDSTLCRKLLVAGGSEFCVTAKFVQNIQFLKKFLRFFVEYYSCKFWCFDARIKRKLQKMLCNGTGNLELTGKQLQKMKSKFASTRGYVRRCSERRRSQHTFGRGRAPGSYEQRYDRVPLFAPATAWNETKRRNDL